MSEELKPMTIKEHLIQLQTKFDNFEKHFTNHLSWHKRKEIALIIIIGSFVAAGLARLLPWPF